MSCHYIYISAEALKCDPPKPGYQLLLEDLQLRFYIQSQPIVALLVLLLGNGALYSLLIPAVVGYTCIYTITPCVCTPLPHVSVRHYPCICGNFVTFPGRYGKWLEGEVCSTTRLPQQRRSRHCWTTIAHLRNLQPRSHRRGKAHLSSITSHLPRPH